jgi:RNA polymerase sigma-70 factor (ECF subfamily)
VGLAGRKWRNYPEEPSSALEELMNDYGQDLLRTAYFYLGDRHLAEDVCQEVFLRVYRKWSTFRGESSVKTWLMTITINLCRDKLGMKSNREEPVDPVLLKQASQSRSAEDEMLRRLSRTTILKHVMELPAQYHEVLYLYYYLEMSTREIAQLTDSPEGTVRARLHRARELLSDCLQEEGWHR